MLRIPSRLLRQIACRTAFLVLAVSLGCGGDSGGGPLTPDASSEIDTGRGGRDSAQDPPATPDVDATGETGPDAADGSGGEPDGSGDAPECASDADCGPNNACDGGQCVRVCSIDAECDQGNLCSEDHCESNRCMFSPVSAVIPDAAPGDCRRLACVEGAIAEIADTDDLPPDDGISCTIESCVDRFPRHSPNDILCDDGVEENGDEVCSLSTGGCSLGGLPYWVCEEFEPGWDDEESCGDGQDNDNDGTVDEECPCEFGAAQRCFTGPPNARNVGGCLDGYQQCIDRAAPHWGPCEGAFLPGTEICDVKDNDCNGCVDDIPDCEPILTCPTEDHTRPLRDYPLDAAAIFGDRIEAVAWSIVAPPNSATRGVEDPDAARTSVYVDVSGDYQISLTITDDKGGVFGCSWILHVQGTGLRVEMRWNTFGSVDVDLHLHRSGSTTDFCTNDDCYYANCRDYHPRLGWGYTDSPPTECAGGTSSCHNPRLDIDNIRGYDPENINIDNPEDGDSFRIMAHMYSVGTFTATNPVISIYCGGVLTSVLGEAPDELGLTRAGGGCMGETWRVADVTMRVDPGTGVTTCDVDVLTDSGGDWDVRYNDDSF